MPRILGVDIPGNKRTDVSLRSIYGIGPARAAEICSRARINPSTRASDLTESDIGTIARILQDQYAVEGDLRRKVAQDIRRLIAIGSYRGQRHRRGLPVRGQRTKTNARTRKGAKKTVGAIRDRSARKMSQAD
jgi:small subunit ribosomal protein S13